MFNANLTTLAAVKAFFARRLRTEMETASASPFRYRFYVDAWDGVGRAEAMRVETLAEGLTAGRLVGDILVRSVVVGNGEPVVALENPTGHIVWSAALVPSTSAAVIPCDYVLGSDPVGGAGDFLAGTWAIGVSAPAGPSGDPEYTVTMESPNPVELVHVPAPVRPEIITERLPPLTTGVPVSVQLEATGDPTWTVTVGDLPDGLTLDGAGLLSGTPTLAGIYGFTARAENDGGHDDRIYSGHVTDPVPDPDPDPAEWIDALAERVVCHLGAMGADPTLAACHVETVAAFVEGFTRGEGFSAAGPDRLLRAVIVTASARLTANPEQMAHYTAGDYSERPAILAGWTAAELGVLRRFRVVTA